MSSEQPLLVVLGATGNQGGSVLSYFLSLSPSPYALRGVTRNLSSPKSTALAARGVEMTLGNFDDPSSLDTAFKGASIIFSVTDFWPAFFDPAQRQEAAASGQSIGAFCRELELQQSRNIINAAAKVTTLKHFIFSSIPNSQKISNGKYEHVYHFEGKGLAQEYGQSAHPKLWEKTTVFYAGLYLENWLSGAGVLLQPKLNKDTDTLVFSLGETLGTASFPIYSSVDDTGALVHSLLRTAPGKKVIGVNEWLSFRDVATLLAQVLGKSIEFVNEDPSFDMGDPDLEKENAEMMGFCVEFGYDGGKVDKSIVQPADLGVPLQLQSVKEWCAKQDWESILQVV
ncbi:hypothetical protein BDW59DRAFT_109781 [Aspergillus cavernicola]|uniref:NmrA-like domain-containing protein n=1 Tax=Aspergillus cavernicola TaxID=176166 RepID=A0ABR4I111_9EURO